jgi:hypothetical protein
MSFFLVGHFEFVFFKKKIVLFFSNDKNLGFHMRYHFFSALWMVSSESWKRGCPN